jgi:hypothetical protein
VNDIIVRDRNGVLLGYCGPQPSDIERMRLIKAERELLTLQIIADHLGLSEIGQTRVADALEAIRLALQVKRRQCGMQADDAQVAAW